jgi:UDP-N-acetylmuramoyl-L-alanine---L-glutamate ligase
MRPKICWSDLRGARVGVWGLGVEGAANLARLRTLGVEPVLVDDRPPGADFEGLPVFATGDSGRTVLSHCDVVVKSPGISRYRPDGSACGCRRPTGTASCSSPARRARAAPRLSPGTC